MARRVYPESELQKHCVRWFRLQYPELRRYLFSSLNGASLSGNTLERKKQWNRLESEGAQAGVCDLTLSLPTKEHHGFYIEMKAPDSTRTRVGKEQIEFMSAMRDAGYKAELVNSFDLFMTLVEAHIFQYHQYVAWRKQTAL